SPDVSGVTSKDDGRGPILVGHFASMTGPEVTWGVSTDEGIRLAAEERNARGGVHGRPVELITLDDASKAQAAGTAATGRITKHQVKAVLGEVASGRSLAGGRVAQSYRVPMISPSSTNETVTQVGNMVYRVCFVDGFQGYVVARFARDHLKASRVGILYDQTQPYSKALSAKFANAFRPLAGSITTMHP